MTNPFLNTADPAQLIEMVRDGVTCEQCKGLKFVTTRTDYNEQHHKCPTCSGTGRIPLPNADLDALAACWCEGEWVRADRTFGGWRYYTHRPFPNSVDFIPLYTTSPDAAMRLQVKYNMGITPLMWDWGEVIIPGEYISMKFKENTIEARCRAITEAALITELTNRMTLL